MKYVLNGAMLVERESAYDEIVRVLPVPAYFGRNLDALWDVVSCMEGEIIIENAAAASGYAEKIHSLLQEAAEENPRFILTIQA